MRTPWASGDTINTISGAVSTSSQTSSQPFRSAVLCGERILDFALVIVPDLHGSDATVGFRCRGGADLRGRVTEHAAELAGEL